MTPSHFRDRLISEMQQATVEIGNGLIHGGCVNMEDYRAKSTELMTYEAAMRLVNKTYAELFAERRLETTNEDNDGTGSPVEIY